MTDANLLLSVVKLALAQHLGTYTFLKGQSTPAAIVIPNTGEILPPEGTRIEGLEAVIFPPLGLAPTPMLSGGYKVREEWTIHLKQWQKGKGVKDAVESLLASDLAEFVVSQVNEVPASVQMGIPAGVQIKLRKHSIIGN